jgi:hypothetical protein
MKKIIILSIAILLSVQSAYSQIQATFSTIDFGIVEIDKPSVQSIEIRNIGQVPLVIGVPRIIENDNEFYSLGSSNCTTLQPDNTCTIPITYTPKIPSEFLASLIIPVETAGFNNIVVNVKGRCAGVVNIASDTLDPIRVWQTNTVAFILRHTGASSYDYRINSTFPVQKTTLNTLTGEFSYTPDFTQRLPFTITFMAKDGNGNIMAEQTVDVQPIPGINPEEVPAGLISTAPVPDSVSRDYTFISSVSEDNTSDTLNGTSAKLRTVTIIGKTLLFSRNSPTSLNLSRLLRAADTSSTPPSDLKQLNLIAETIIIRDSLILKRTNVNITAKELLFIDEETGPRACINITPAPVSPNAASGQTGRNGFHGSEINLKIHNFRSFTFDGITPRIVTRFIAAGGEGQTITSAESATIKPGNGGNGGILRVNKFSLDANSLQQYFDAPGGLSGSNSPLTINRTGATGQPGSFTIRDNGEYDWVHPSWVRMGLLHLRDAYLLEKWDYVISTSREYELTLNDLINAGNEFTTPYRSELDITEVRSLAGEAEEMNIRVNQNLDYFGNPFGWAPNLSFEYNLASYQNEIDYAIPALAFIYQIQNRFNVLQLSKNQTDQLLDTLGSRQKELVRRYNALNIDLDSTTIEVKQIEEQTASLQVRLEQRANDLIAQAKNNTKRKGLRRVAQVAGSIAQVAASITGNKLIGRIGMGLEAASNMEFNGNLIKNSQAAYKEYKSLEEEWKKNGENLRNSLPDPVKKALENPESTDKYPPIGAKFGVKNSDIAKYLNENLTNLANLRSSLKKMSSAIRTGAAPAHVVEAELARLRASDPEFNSLINEIQQLTIRRGQLLEKIDRLIADITFVINELPRLYLSASILADKNLGLTAKLDPRIGPYMKDMEKSVRDRLLLYNYFMRKSYEYRFLRSYPYSSNPLTMFDRLRDTVASAGSGTIQPQLVEGMKTIFQNDLRSIASKLNSDFNLYGTKREPAPQEYRFTREQVALLNKGETVTINPYVEIPRIRTSNNLANEDIRITKLEFDFSVTTVNSQGSTPSMKLTAEYPNRFSLSKSGVDYVFVKRGDNLVTWEGEKTGNNDIFYTKVAESELSLIRTLLNNDNNIQYFSLPSANADIMFYSVLTDRTNAIIDTTKPVRLLVYYEYRQQITSERILFITTNSKLLRPTMLMSRNSVDINRRDGHGSINRTFTSGNVSVEAQEKYGVWQFDRWEATDAGTTIANPKDPVLSISMNAFRSVRAVYQGPLTRLEIKLANQDKELLRLNNKPVLTYDPLSTTITDTVSLISYSSFLDGRRILTTSTTSFTVHPDDASMVVIENNNVIKLKKEPQLPEIEQVRVIARHVSNDIEMYDIVTLRIQKSPVSVKETYNNMINVQLYPNPISQQSSLKFSTKKPGMIKIALYEMTGKIMKIYCEQFMNEGEKEFVIDSLNFPNGKYYIDISTPEGKSTLDFIIHK